MIKTEIIPTLNRHSVGERISASKENRKNKVLDRMADRPGPAQQVISPVTTTPQKKFSAVKGFWITASAAGNNGLTYFGEYDRSTNSISLDRFRYAPDGGTIDIAGDTKFVYLLGFNKLMHEYDAETLTRIRTFEMSWQPTSRSGKVPFATKFPILYNSLFAIAYRDNMMVLIGRGSPDDLFEDQLVIIDFKGEDRMPVIRSTSKNTADIFADSIVPNDSIINAIAIGDEVLYSVSGNGWHTNIDIQTLLQTGRVFNNTSEEATPAGAKIIDGQYYMGNRNVLGAPHTIERRRPTTFTIIRPKVNSYFPVLRGLG